MPEQLLGPLALTVGSLIAVVALWRLVGDYITELKTSRDRYRTLAENYEDKFDGITDAVAPISTVLAALDRIERRLEQL